MTTQIPDTIFFGGNEHITYADPLSYRAGLPDFMAMITSNHRGYTAVWTVVGSHLFIVSLSGYVPGVSREGLELVFPSAQAPVLADWYSGELGLLSGRVINQDDMFPIYERQTVLTIENGRVLNHHLVKRN